MTCAFVSLIGSVMRRVRRMSLPAFLWLCGGVILATCGGAETPDRAQPARHGPAAEESLVAAAAERPSESVPGPKMEGVAPALSPEESLSRITTKPGFAVELVAAEPEVIDPVAIDFGADGKVWVVEMHDYPLGMDGKGQPGGRVKFLEDSDGDGRYEKATVFLDGLPFPTGVMAWRNGVLITAAPDILHAEDTDGDGRADRVEKLFTGFATENFQARVNGLSYGLDNWIHGANGLLGGIITGRGGKAGVDIRGRDFRMHPDTGAFEPVAGLTQQGRVRDDWGQWFGSDNSTLAWHYPLPERYLRRNPALTPPAQRVSIAGSPRVFPTSRTLARYNDPDNANRATGACGEAIYRDNLLGNDFEGDYFVTESVHNLVTRLELRPRGVTFEGVRAEGETESEFFSSSDNWSRPVQVRTGPDGALWIVDMYRYVIEHPRWISAEQLARLDVRAGDDKGRIYRVYPRDRKLRPIRDLTRLPAIDLVAAMDTPNGPVRDLVQARLVQSGDASIAEALAALARQSEHPAVRVQALATLEGLRALSPVSIEEALRDEHAGVRRFALSLGEPFFDTTPSLAAAAAALAGDPEITVRYQLALSLGEWNAPEAGRALGRLALNDRDDSWMSAAILSSSMAWPEEVLDVVLGSRSPAAGQGELIGGLIAAAVAGGAKDRVVRLASAMASGDEETEEAETWRFAAWTGLIDALERRQWPLDEILAHASSGDQALAAKVDRLFTRAAALGFDSRTPAALREAALRFYGFRAPMPDEVLKRWVEVFETATEAPLRQAALEALRRQSSPALAAIVLDEWARRSPAARAGFLELLLGRESWTMPLLGALESGLVSGVEISAPHRDHLLQHAQPAVRERARKIFAAFHPRRRAEVLAAYRGVDAMPGDESRGREIFERACAICHAARGRGYDIGPDISLFRDKAAPEFLDAILDPNAVIEPRFGCRTKKLRCL